MNKIEYLRLRLEKEIRQACVGLDEEEKEKYNSALEKIWKTLSPKEQLETNQMLENYPSYSINFDDLNNEEKEELFEFYKNAIETWGQEDYYKF